MANRPARYVRPYEVEVSGLLHAGENTIRVGSGQPGHQRNGQRSDGGLQSLIAKYGDRFQDQDTAKPATAAFGSAGPGAADREVSIMKITRRNALGILATTATTAALEQDAAGQTAPMKR